MNTIKARSKEHIRSLIKDAMKKYGNECDLNHIDVSEITSLKGLFATLPYGKFHIDVSEMTSLNGVFGSKYENNCSAFNGDISRWNTSNVTDMSSMFYDSKFQGDISNWDVSKVTTMNMMFSKSVFNGDISRWNTSKVLNMAGMFTSSVFNGDISGWDISKVESHVGIFSQFHDSPLGYIGVLRNEYDFPKDHPQAATFQSLRSLCEGLHMDYLSAAQHIYQEMHHAPQVEPMPFGNLFEC